MSGHTRGPWMLATSNSWRRIMSRDGAHVCTPVAQRDGHPDLHFPNGGETGPDAALLIAAPELLSELQAAHQIILNALQIMTPEQKDAWAKANGDLVESGTTRFHERAAVIAKAQGQAS